MAGHDWPRWAIRFRGAIFSVFALVVVAAGVRVVRVAFALEGVDDGRASPFLTRRRQRRVRKT